MDPAAHLIEEFEESLSFFERELTAGFEPHIQTIQRRHQFESLAYAIPDDQFLSILRATLSGWTLRRAGLVQLDEFVRVLREHTQAIQSLEGLELGAAEIADFWEEVWAVIIAVPITRKGPRLVSGTKLLHHLLSNLVVPVDRIYTGTFLFAYKNNDFTAGGERETFRAAFHCFSRIARLIGPRIGDYQRRHVAHTSISKVIDNAIMGFVEHTRQQLWHA
jgi:hypothetical protein